MECVDDGGWSGMLILCRVFDGFDRDSAVPFPKIPELDYSLSLAVCVCVCLVGSCQKCVLRNVLIVFGQTG